jgi:hypothetical protein
MGGGDNNKMRSWIKPKMSHKMMVQRLLRTKCALICCLRGEEKTHITKPTDGQKGKVITDEFSTPLFDPRFIFEMLLNFETVAHNGVGGYVVPRKITHPSIAALLPVENEQISVKHGESLMAWCNQAGAGGTTAGGHVQSSVAGQQNAPTGTQGTITDAETLKKLEIELWTVLKPIRKAGVTSKTSEHPWTDSGANVWLWREEILDAAKEPAECAPDLTPERFREVIQKAKERLATP